jgi:hypothetical protein
MLRGGSICSHVLHGDGERVWYSMNTVMYPVHLLGMPKCLTMRSVLVVLYVPYGSRWCQWQWSGCTHLDHRTGCVLYGFAFSSIPTVKFSSSGLLDQVLMHSGYYCAIEGWRTSRGIRSEVVLMSMSLAVRDGSLASVCIKIMFSSGYLT